MLRAIYCNIAATLFIVGEGVELIVYLGSSASRFTAACVLRIYEKLISYTFYMMHLHAQDEFLYALNVLSFKLRARELIIF